MNKILIIYLSKTGFSQRYAQWLAEELNCEAVPFQAGKRRDLSGFDTIILIGGLYAGQMSGLKWFKTLPAAGKKLAAVAVGCSPADFPGHSESMRQLFGDAPQIKGFYCQGGLDYGRMGAVDRAMMAALRLALRHKPEQKDMLEGISQSFDASDRRYLSPIVDWVREA